MSASEYLEKWCEYRGLSVLLDIQAQNRKREAFRIRREAVTELRLAGFGWSEIARAMKRHHSTIMHAVGAA